MWNSRWVLLALAVAALVAGCGRAPEAPADVETATPPRASTSTRTWTKTPTSAPSPTAEPTRRPEPSPTVTVEQAPAVTIEGKVGHVSLSARVITMQEPVGGYTVVGLTEESELLSVGGAPIELAGVLPGMTVEVTGRPGQEGALLAERVRLLAEPERIAFEQGATFAQLSGQVGAQESRLYVLRAAAGQTMRASLSAPGAELLLGIRASDGTVLKSTGEGGLSWIGRLPSTQDYVLEVVAPEEPVDYQLAVVIPVLIEFDPGETGASFSGELGEHDVDHYVLWAAEGQTMDVAVSAPDGPVGLTIVGEDGLPLKRYVDEQEEWTGELPASQRYFIQVNSIEPVDYELSVKISREPVEAAIELLAPGPGERWIEGQTYLVAWGSIGVEQVDIAVALGGKDKGLIAQAVDADEGQYAWTIPEGFVSGFGVSESEASVMVVDSSDPAVGDENEGEFTIAAGAPVP